MDRTKKMQELEINNKYKVLGRKEINTKFKKNHNTAKNYIFHELNMLA